MSSDPKTTVAIMGEIFPNWNKLVDQKKYTTVLDSNLWGAEHRPQKRRRKGKDFKKKDIFSDWFSYTLSVHNISFTRDVKAALVQHCKELNYFDAENLIKSFKDLPKEQILLAIQK